MGVYIETFQKLTDSFILLNIKIENPVAPNFVT